MNFSINKFISENGYFHIPRNITSMDIVKKEILDNISNGKIKFPYKKMFIKNPQILFDNLVHYSINVETKYMQYRPLTWKVKDLINYKYRDKYLSFKTQFKDYKNIDQLTDYFTDYARMNARKSNKLLSPYEQWNNLDKIIDYHINKNKPLNSYELRESLWKRGLECTSFKLTIAISVYKYFKVRNVLDISAGWGDRLLSAIAYGCDYYLGYDPNLDLEKGHNEIIRTFANDTSQYEIRYEPFETADLPNKTFDLIFTSPPYFDFEHYSDHDQQSIKRYPEQDNWTVHFLFVSLWKSWQNLENNGHMIIHITDLKVDTYVEKMILFVLGWCKNSFFEGVIGAINEKDNVNPMWVFVKDKQREKDENISKHNMEKHYDLIFDKIQTLSIFNSN